MLIIITFSFLILTSFADQNPTLTDFGGLQSGRMTDGDPIIRQVTKNVYQCNQLCQVTKSCMSFSYDVTSGSCTTFSSSVVDSALDTREDRVVHSELIDFETKRSCDRSSCPQDTVCMETGTSYMCANQTDKGFFSFNSVCQSHSGYSWSSNSGICYKFSTNTANRQKAIGMCKQDGGRLIKIDSAKKQRNIETILSDPQYENKLRFWIGADDTEVEGEWRWTDGSLVEFSYWAPGKPNGKSDPEDVEDYAALATKERSYMWNDFKPHRTFVALCEIVL